MKYWDMTTKNIPIESSPINIVRYPPTLVWNFPVRVDYPILNLEPRKSRLWTPYFDFLVESIGFC